MRYFFSLIFLCSHLSGWVQSIQIGFYNVENLFDTINAPFKNDGEFTPLGEKRYGTQEYLLKVNRIARVIAAMNDWKGIDAIGLAEVENENVLKDLITGTVLKQMKYEYIHFESPDERGIDVALLYKSKLFRVDTIVQINIDMKEERPTRDLLHVRLIKDTSVFDIFVNHWPSRYGGVLETEPKRMSVAQKLSEYIAFNEINAPLVIGDFNDPPTSSSIKWLLQETMVHSLPLTSAIKLGTMKYQNNWFWYDQILLSNKWDPFIKEAKIFSPEWLIEEDLRFNGITPKRFFRGNNFNDGYSDHLPIYVRFKL